MLAALALSLVIAAWASRASAQPGPDGIDWVTIGATNNLAYNREDRGGNVTGRGSVPWLYRMGRTEVTTATWVEFFNAVYARATPLVVNSVNLIEPLDWGAEIDPTYNGPGMKWRVSPSVPNAAMLPANAISWRVAAVLCNWLHNDKRNEPSAFMNGAYDTMTFGYPPGGGAYTDQAVHNPDAKYWIPTIDEWLKASYFDPNKDGNGQGGWWRSPNGSDNALIYGPPGQGQANALFDLPNEGQWRIPLGAYPDTRTAFGLLDVSGGTTEWTEEDLYGKHSDRSAQGSAAGSAGGAPIADRPDIIFGHGPFAVSTDLGFRLASSVPTPATLLVMFSVLYQPRRRQQ